jgi:radical SAM protein with 4Fe4S-binding SPASM domain
MEVIKIMKLTLSSCASPKLLAQQAAIALAFKTATNWKFEGRWLKNLTRLLKVASGAAKAGCFGYAPHPVLEVTGRCNLNCIHCEVRGGEPKTDPSLSQIYRMIDSIATVPEFKMVALTGGEPLLRQDIYEIISYAKNVGFEVTVATNGTLISRKTAKKLSSLDVAGVAVSLDFTESKLQDEFRGMNGAWKMAIEGMKNAVKEGLYLQANISLSRLNFKELQHLLKLADELGSCVVLLYQFQPFGRGKLREELALTSSEFLKVIESVFFLQRQLKALVIPVGLPQYFAYLSDKTPLLKGMFKGCIAGNGMFYVRWYGDVWPCAFLQKSIGNVMENTALEIWTKNRLLSKIRDRHNLEEPCRSCKYRENCGGCRSRAYLMTGNIMASDPACPIINQNAGKRGASSIEGMFSYFREST